MKRIYEAILEDHFDQNTQAAFLSGPRQVGKTTLAKNLMHHYPYGCYFNWDSYEDQTTLLSGQQKLIEQVFQKNISFKIPLVIFDELHKFRDWKNYLKGFVDISLGKIHTLVTGSSKLNVFRRGGDSLMGRYFLYRIHPLSFRETITPTFALQPSQPPLSLNKVDQGGLEHLYQFGGFPDPFLRGDVRFLRRWHQLRLQQLYEEEILTLTQIRDFKLIETLMNILRNQSGQLLNFASIASKIRVSEPTVRHWITILEQFYYGFTITPWSTNITRSLLKTPKFYLWDWSLVKDPGQRWENLVASHLLKAVHFWVDAGLGSFDCHYLRDKEKNEVDFLITKDQEPWLMVEVKSSDNAPLNKSLHRFQSQLRAPHVIQVAMNLPYQEVDCFSFNGSPKIVPGASLLSQLI